MNKIKCIKMYVVVIPVLFRLSELWFENRKSAWPRRAKARLNSVSQ